MAGADPSPLQRSRSGPLKLVGVLLGVLAVLFGVGGVLALATEEGKDALAHGLTQLGVAVVCGGLAVPTFALGWWWARPASGESPPTAITGPGGEWRRVRVGPAWTDWLVLLFPFALVLPPLYFRDAPLNVASVVTAVLVIALLGGLMGSQVLAGRREPMLVRLHPQGLVVVLRSGAVEELPFGVVREVRLGTRQVKRLTLGLLELHRAHGEPLVFREPMSAPLPEIARACASHMSAPLSGTWGLAPARG